MKSGADQLATSRVRQSRFHVRILVILIAATLLAAAHSDAAVATWDSEP